MEKEIEDIVNSRYFGWVSLYSFYEIAYSSIEGCNPAWQEIDNIIKNASLEMCLTSKYEYIRECKKWFEKNKEKG